MLSLLMAKIRARNHLMEGQMSSKRVSRIFVGLVVGVGIQLLIDNQVQSEEPVHTLSEENQRIWGSVQLGIEWALGTADDPHSYMRKMLKHPSKEVRCRAMQYLPTAAGRHPEKMLVDFYSEIEAQLSEDDGDSSSGRHIVGETRTRGEECSAETRKASGG